MKKIYFLFFTSTLTQASCIDVNNFNNYSKFDSTTLKIWNTYLEVGKQLKSDSLLNVINQVVKDDSHIYMIYFTQVKEGSFVNDTIINKEIEHDSNSIKYSHNILYNSAEIDKKYVLKRQLDIYQDFTLNQDISIAKYSVSNRRWDELHIIWHKQN